MSTVKLYDPDIWPIIGGHIDSDGKWIPGEEVSNEHFEQIRKNIWLIEHPCAGNIDTTVAYGKWVGNASNFEYVEYDQYNWKGWNPGATYHYGSPIVKYRWGPGTDQIDIFVFFSKMTGDKLDGQPPVIGGKLNSNYWLLTVDPNKYAHWNKNAGRPDIGADDRWIISQHGYKAPPDGPGWIYGRWEAWRELTIHTNPFEQIPHIKQGGVDEARHYPVEQKKDWITKQIRPTMERKYQDGFVGDPPTYWVHHEDRETISEYVYKTGDPVGSIQVGPDIIEPKYNQSLQDRVIHCIEKNYQYLKEVDDEWKESFNFSSTYGQNIDPDYDDGCSCVENYQETYRGSFAVGQTYYKEEIVYHNLYWWRCIKDLYNAQSSEAPGEPGGAEYWAKPRHQPDYIDSDPVYIQFASYLFNCNCSAFEKVLKSIGKYDWYYDEQPAVPWWLYQKHYYLMTLHKADPDAGWAKKAEERWPLPCGCWRKVWRHTMCWDHDRGVGQKARLGKTIEIDGKKVSMMWPGDLGPPPGHDSIEIFTGELGGYHYNTRQLALVITQDQFDKMERPPSDATAYTKYYLPGDNIDGKGNSIEDLFRSQYRLHKNSVESRLKAGHDPLATEWHQNQTTGELKEYPVFEMKPDILNDLKAALEQLILLKQSADMTVYSLYSTDTIQNIFSTSLASYRDAKSIVDNLTSVTENEGNSWGVGYIACVWANGPNAYVTAGGGGICSRWTEKYWGRIEVVKPDEECFPAASVGQAVFDVRGYGFDGVQKINDFCTAGFGDFAYKPSDLVPKRVYVGSLSLDCEWVYNSGESKWEKICTLKVEPADPWPDEFYFDWQASAAGECRSYSRQSGFQIVFSNQLAWEINFDGFDERVFEEDPTNYIEV